MVLLLLTAGCSTHNEGHNEASELLVPDAIAPLYGQIWLDGQKTDLEDLQKKDHRLFSSPRFFNRDLDHDGIPDRLDGDADGDGTDNLLDLSPFDFKVGGEDQDEDGIPDFADSDNELQKPLFEQTRIVVIDSSAPGADRVSEIEKFILDLVYKEGFQWIKRETGSTLTIVVNPSGSSAENLNLGNFNRLWRTIRINANEPRFSDQFYSTLVHELFHVFQDRYPELMKDFMKAAGWQAKPDGFRFRDGRISFSVSNQEVSTADIKVIKKQGKKILNHELFPSDYCLLGPYEMFSEFGRLHYFDEKSAQNTPGTERIQIWRNGSGIRIFLDLLRKSLGSVQVEE